MQIEKLGSSQGEKLKYLILMLGLIAPFSAGAQSLWRDLPAGATVSQVRQTLPGATEPSKPSIMADGQTAALLEYEGFQLAAMDFKATLYFRQGKLATIALNPTVAPSGIDARVAASKLRDGLVAKYGPPVNAERSRSSLSTGETMEWAQSGAVIKFRFTQYGDSDGTGFLQVLYMAPQDTPNL